MPSIPSFKSALPGPIAIDPNRLGDLAERWVTLLASWKGCEVFENIGCSGKTDLVIVHPTMGPIQVDVKCSTWRDDKNSWDPKNTHSVKAPVWPVIVEPDGDVASWRVRWVRNRCPLGWENFWSNDNRFYSTK